MHFQSSAKLKHLVNLFFQIQVVLILRAIGFATKLFFLSLQLVFISLQANTFLNPRRYLTNGRQFCNSAIIFFIFVLQSFFFIDSPISCLLKIPIYPPSVKFFTRNIQSFFQKWLSFQKSIFSDLGGIPNKKLPLAFAKFFFMLLLYSSWFHIKQIIPISLQSEFCFVYLTNRAGWKICSRLPPILSKPIKLSESSMSFSTCLY